MRSTSPVSSTRRSPGGLELGSLYRRMSAVDDLIRSLENYNRVTLNPPAATPKGYRSRPLPKPASRAATVA